MPDPKAMNRGQSSPNSNESAVPETAPTTKRMPAARLQRRARAYHVASRRAQADAFGDAEHEGQANTQRGENDVKGQRHRQ